MALKVRERMTKKMKVYIIASLKVKKLNTLVKTRKNENYFVSVSKK
jgi:hypothetical protein